MLSSPVEEIKNRLSIVDIVSGYLKLNKAGANYKALCPFHNEKTPSFMVSPSKQIWHCFSCGEGGDIFSFVMKIEGLEFSESLKILAKKAGVTLKEGDPKEKSRKNRFLEICELAAKFFQKQLNVEIKDYLKERGVSDLSVEQWRIGWAPEKWNALSGFLLSKGFKESEICEIGLASKSERGGIIDRFRGRIIFPIFDILGNVVGFGGRIFKNEKDLAKYINTTNTPLYDKSRILYGLNYAKNEIRKKDSCIIVEGYMDVIMSHQAGVENTVACSGTALTEYQLGIIKRYTNSLIFCFDMDGAGELATKRGIEEAIGFGFDMKIIVLSGGKDTADVVKSDKEEWKKAVEEKLSIVEFYFNQAFKKFDPKSVEGKKDISDLLLPIIKKIPHKIEQSFWLDKLAEILNIKENVLREQMNSFLIEARREGELKEKIGSDVFFEKEKNIVRKILEKRLLGLILVFGDSISEMIKNRNVCFSDETFKFIYESFLREGKKMSLDGDKKILADSLVLMTEDSYSEIFDVESEVIFCLNHLEKEDFKINLEKLNKSLKEAEKKGDHKKVESLLTDLNFLLNKLNN